MNGFKNIDEVKNFFKNDLYATELSGIEILEVKDNYAKCSMKITPKHRNAAGGVMSGAIFTLADFCQAVATNKKDNLAVAAQASISFLSGSKGEILYAENLLQKDGRRNAFNLIKIYDDLGVTVAEATFVTAKL